MRTLTDLRSRAGSALLVLGLLGAALGSPAKPATAYAPQHDQDAVATGTGGAVASEHPEASKAAIAILDRGGNAVDAAVAAAAVQGVTRPFSGGVGGGGMMMVHLAETGKTVVLDHREVAAQSFGQHAFMRADGSLLTSDERKTSGVAVGVPGAVAAWEKALSDHGTMTLREVLAPAIKVAERGFTIDANYVRELSENRDRISAFSSSAELFLNEDGSVPSAGSTVRNPDLAATYRAIAKEGAASFYTGSVGKAIVETVSRPPLAENVDREVWAGGMTMADLADYEVIERDATTVRYRDYDVLGAGPPSSGGSTIAEALNILEGYDLASMTREGALHHYLEASRLAFADRDAYLGDPAASDVPVDGLLSDGFATERRRSIQDTAATGQVLPGTVFPYQEDPTVSAPPETAPAEEFSYDFAPRADGYWDRTRFLVENSRRATVEVADGVGRVVLPGERFASIRAVSQMASVENAELRVPVRTEELGADRRLRLWLRADGWATSTTPTTGYGVELRSGSGLVRVIRRADGEYTEIGRFSRARSTDWERLRFRVDGSRLLVKLWPSGEAEPADWHLELTDDRVTGPGRFLLSSLEFSDDGGGAFGIGPLSVQPLGQSVSEEITDPARAPEGSDEEDGTEPPQTIHLSVSDASRNVVAYTSTIVSIGGNGMVVPGHGFLLNDALSGRTPDALGGEPWHPNAPRPGMRPLSSMSPTIVLHDGRPVVTLGAPGSATIITTVLQTLVQHLDLGMSLPEAVAAPRASQRNTSTGNTVVEPDFTSQPEYDALRARGHTFTRSTLTQGIGAVTGISFLPDGRVTAAAEPVRRGGGSAMVQEPER